MCLLIASITFEFSSKKISSQVQSALSGSETSIPPLLAACAFYLSFSVYVIVRRLPTLFLSLKRLLLGVAGDHSSLVLALRVVAAKHQVVRPEHPCTVPRYLRFLNLDRFLHGAVHEVILTRGV